MIPQLDLFGDPIAIPFDGETFDAAQDGERLSTQLARVRASMESGDWWTLKDLSIRTGGTEAAVSARIRDLRKPKFGGLIVERRRVPGASGLWEYRIKPATV